MSPPAIVYGNEYLSFRIYMVARYKAYGMIDQSPKMITLRICPGVPSLPTIRCVMMVNIGKSGRSPAI